jgi:hypothetical protein
MPVSDSVANRFFFNLLVLSVQPSSRDVLLLLDQGRNNLLLDSVPSKAEVSASLAQGYRGQTK